LFLSFHRLQQISSIKESKADCAEWPILCRCLSHHDSMRRCLHRFQERTWTVQPAPVGRTRVPGRSHNQGTSVPRSRALGHREHNHRLPEGHVFCDVPRSTAVSGARAKRRI
jgi:hypothetical protein